MSIKFKQTKYMYFCLLSLNVIHISYIRTNRQIVPCQTSPDRLIDGVRRQNKVSHALNTVSAALKTM